MRFRIPISIAITTGVLWALSCAKPTQARVHISLKSACATATGPEGVSITNFVIYVGPGLSEVNAREAEHTWSARVSCDAVTSDTTLVLYPETTRGAVVRVVAGVQRMTAGAPPVTVLAEQCGTGAAGGCIRATRSFQYVENETLELPISLDVRCAGVLCDTPDGTATCVQGACVSTTCQLGSASCSEDSLPRKDASVEPPPDVDVKPPIVDAGVDAEIDAATDGETDAATDAGISFPPVLTFSCSSGDAKFTTSSCTVPPQAECYSESSPNQAVCGKLGECQMGFLPCCSKRLIGQKRACCLSKNTFYPIEVPKEERDTACDDRELCFPKAQFQCSDFSKVDGGQRVCVPVADGSWGYCSP